MEVVSNNYMPGDQRLIQQIVYELKSQGIFDNFRKECIADVDTKPAYQNLRQRVEGSVASFLTQQTWSNDMNKNQIREQLRKNIHDMGFLDSGVERIVEQVVNPKINSIFLPRVEDVVYRYLGIRKPERAPPVETANTEIRDLLPMDLEAVSPESNHNDRNESFNVSISKMDGSTCVDNLSNKLDEDESPPFEALDTEPNVTTHNENSVDSQISHYSGARSHDDSNHGSDTKICQMDISSVDSQTSQNSCESHLSIVISEETKMDISEDSQTTREKPGETSVNIEITNGTSVDVDSDVAEKAEVISEDVSLKTEKKPEVGQEDISSKNEKTNDTEIYPDTKDNLSKSDEKKTVEKKSDYKSDTKEKSKNIDKSSSRDKKDDGRHSKSNKDRSKFKSSSSKDKVTSTSSLKLKENSSSSSSHSSIKDKDHEASSSSRNKESSSKDKSKSKDRRDSKSSSSHKITEKYDKERNNEKHDKDKIKVEDRSNEKKSADKLLKEKLDKEKSEKDKSRKEKSDKSSKDKSEKVRDDKEKSDKDKPDKDKLIKDKSNRDKDKSEKLLKDKSDKEKHSKNDKDIKEKDEKDRSEKKKERSEKDKSKSTSSSKERSSSSSHRDKNRSSSSGSKDKLKSNSDTSGKKSDSKSVTKDGDIKPNKSDSKSKYGDKIKSDDKHNHSASKHSKDKKKEKQTKDDHYSSKDKKGDRRSTDRDSNDGSSSKPSHSNLFSEKKPSHKATPEGTSSSISGSNDSSSNSDAVETPSRAHLKKLLTNEVPPNVTEIKKLKYLKPKFASNFQEAIKIMKIRKQIAKLERQNQLSLSEINLEVTVQNGFDDSVKPKTRKLKPENSSKASLISPDTCDSPKEIPSTPIKTTNLSQESWEALEARLAQEMSNINYNSYGLCDDDDDYSVSEIVISPAKDQVMLVEDSGKSVTEVEDVMKHVPDCRETHNSTKTFREIVKCQANIDEFNLAIGLQVEDKNIEVDAALKEDQQIHKIDVPSREDSVSNMELSGDMQEEICKFEESNIEYCNESNEETAEIPEAHVQLPSKEHCTEEMKSPVKSEILPDNPHIDADYPQLDSPPCYYLEKPSPSVEQRLQFLHDFVAQLEHEVVATRTNFENCHRGIKRKREDYVDAKNNNKADYEQSTEVKKRLRPPNTAISKAIKDKTNQCTDVISNEGFSLPLSPESDISNDKKEEETARPEKKRKSNAKGAAQRYSSDELYKPRPSFVGTRRTRSAKNV